MNITLYQAVLDKQNAIMACADEDGVIDTEKLALIEGTFREKTVAYVAVNKTLAHRAAGLMAQRDAVVAEYDAEIHRIEVNRQNLHAALYNAMKTTGTLSVDSDDGLLSAKLYLDRDESVELDEGAVFPAELCADPMPPGPSRLKIKVAILAGQPVAGARIVRRDRLTLR